VDPDKLDKVVMNVLRFHREVRDREFQQILQEKFPEEKIIKSWVSAWDYPPVERSLMRLKARGLVTARKDYRGRLVDWRAVDPLDLMADI